jgi:hypothetical protein
MKKNYLLKTAMILAVFFTTVQFAQAQKAWGYVNGVLSGSLLQDHLYEFDLTTGAPTLLGGPISCGNANFMSTGEFINGTFYMLESSGNLYSVSNTGVCTFEKAITGLLVNQIITSMTYDMSSNTVYVVSSQCNVATNLYTLDLATGVLTSVGNITGVTCAISVVIDNSGNAYIIDVVSDQIYPLNLNTAVPGIGVPLTRTGGIPLDINFGQDADFGCAPSGTLYASIFDNNAFSGFLGTLDPVTGVFTETVNTGAQIAPFAVDCSVPVCPSPFTVTLTPKGVNLNKWGPAPSDPYTFYHGLSQWKKIKSTVTGGVGPFTYVWGNIGSGQIKNVGSKIDQKFLYQPTGATKVYLNVTDQSTNCTFGDTIDIAWNDDYFCGSMTPYIQYMLLICENGVTKCETWRNGFNKIKAGNATLGACNVIPAKRADEIDINELSAFPNPVADLLNISLPGEAGQMANVVILDSKGQVMLTQEIQATGSDIDATIDMQQFASGLYLLNVEVEGKVYSEKVQVLK